MIAGGLPFFEIARHHAAHIPKWQPTSLGLFHHAYAPVHVGREAVTGVVGRGAGNLAKGIERLMAHQHTVAERAPREFLRGGKPPMAQETVVVVNDVGIAIDHCRQLPAAECALGNVLKSMLVGQEIAGIEEAYVVASAHVEPFVHCIVDAVVAFGYSHDGVFTAALSVVADVAAHDVHRLVGRSAVHDDVLHSRIGLAEHAVECLWQQSGCVVGYGYYAKGNHSL